MASVFSFMILWFTNVCENRNDGASVNKSSHSSLWSFHIYFIIIICSSFHIFAKPGWLEVRLNVILQLSLVIITVKHNYDKFTEDSWERSVMNVKERRNVTELKGSVFHDGWICAFDSVETCLGWPGYSVQDYLANYMEFIKI